METAAHLLARAADPSRIRNFCVVAHVDHGKTTLSDFLVASNGILSSQLAGKVRLLDSRPDEQERLITMKASSIALSHRLRQTDTYLLNLVDSPGHIDFSCEVSAAVRLCDGAVVLVDLVDGVTMQTCGMLRHMHREGLPMCLVLNKIDLLITRQQMTADEAYLQMRTVIETCNATIASFVAQQRIAAGEVPSATNAEARQEAGKDGEEEDDDDAVWFSPAKGNVVFASCFDGWGFTTANFAALYRDKLKVDLQASLWGEFYLDPKTRTSVSTTPKKEEQKPIAVQLMLEPLWQLYRGFCAPEPDMAALVAMSAKLGIAETVWNHSKRDMRGRLGLLLAHWLPLATTVLDVVCDHLPSPPVAQAARIPQLMPNVDKLSATHREQLLNCCSDPTANPPTIAFVSKLVDTQFLVGQSLFAPPELPAKGAALAPALTDEDVEQMFVGFTRVYCGRLRVGDRVFVHSNNNAGIGASATTAVESGTIAKLYSFRGLGLEEVPEVLAGCLCGVAGLTKLITKHATIVSDASIPPLMPLSLPSSSIVRLAVQPKDPQQLQRLVQGLCLLNKVDAQVEVSILPTGEHVIATAGEVHAERCVKDLRDEFARMEIVVSEPLVSFRETIVTAPGKPKSQTAVSPEGLFSLTLHARRLPDECLAIIADDATNVPSAMAATAAKVLQALDSSTDKKKQWADVLRNGLVAAGPAKLGFCGAFLFCTIRGNDGDEQQRDESSTAAPQQLALFEHFRESIIAGFQLASVGGPMADEPVWGVAFVITDMRIGASVTDIGDRGLSGQVMVAARDACRKAMELHGRRLVEPIFQCTVYGAGATQGKVYGILNRRRADIVEEVPHEGSDLYYITAHLPVTESFGLQDELRIATHGAATAQLQMSRWAVLEVDPYWKPTTKEELEDEGSTAPVALNLAAAILERIRKRKGMHRGLVVESAEKQKKFSVRGA